MQKHIGHIFLYVCYYCHYFQHHRVHTGGATHYKLDMFGWLWLIHVLEIY